MQSEANRVGTVNGGGADPSAGTRELNRPGVGVFGTGALARRLIGDLRRLDYTVTALWGRTRAAAEKVALELKIGYYSHREEEVLLKEGVELVVLACAPHFQWLIATKALGIGRNVLMVPPFATTHSEISQLAERAATYSRLMSTVLQPLRYTTAFRIARSILHLSEIVASRDSQSSVSDAVQSTASTETYADLQEQLRCVRVRGGRLSAAGVSLGRLCVVDVRACSDLARKRERFGWSCDWQMAGGTLASLGASVVDSLRFLTGCRCAAVRGFATTCRTRTGQIGGIREISADDYCAFQARLERGCMVNVTLNGLCALDNDCKSSLSCLLLDNEDSENDSQSLHAALTFVFVGELGTLTLDTRNAEVRVESFTTGRTLVIETNTTKEAENEGENETESESDNEAEASSRSEKAAADEQCAVQLKVTSASNRVSESECMETRPDERDIVFERHTAQRLSVRKRPRTSVLSSVTSEAHEDGAVDGVQEQLRLIRECFKVQKEQRSASIAIAEESSRDDRPGSLRKRTTESAVWNGSPFSDLPHVDEWLEVQSVLEAVRESSRSGSWCNVAPHGATTALTRTPTVASSVSASTSLLQLQPLTNNASTQNNSKQSSVNEKHHSTGTKKLYRS